MKKNARRFWTVTAICGGTALLFLVMVWDGFDPLQKLEFYTQDVRATLGVKTPVDPRLAFIGIDRTEYKSLFSEEKLKAYPALQLLQMTYPWSRAVWADLVQRLAEAGAKVIILDLYFGGTKEGDDALRQVLNTYKDRVVVSANFHDLKSDRVDSMTLDLPNISVLDNSSTNAEGYDTRLGYVNVWPDSDGILRRAQYRMVGGKTTDVLPQGAQLESIDAVALRQFGASNQIPSGSDPIRFRYTYWGGAGYPAISLADAMDPKTWKQNFNNGEFFRGKIVIIGPASDIFQDAQKTPFPEASFGGHQYSSIMLGPEIHLNIISAALHGRFLRDTGLYENLLIILLAGLLASTLSFLVHQPLRRLAAIAVLAVAYWYGAQWMFNRADLVMPVASPLLVLTLSGVFVLAYDYFVEKFERTRTRKMVERYVSKNIAAELLDNPETLFHTLGGVRKPVTVLFCDIRNFTTMTEHSEETQLVKQLNEYFAEMTQHVFKLEGTLDKFIGDCVMAVWGNLLSQGTEKDAQNAVLTALAMKRSLVKLNEDWKKRGMPELAFGIGINHGQAIVGNLGSNEKMELTVIGDAVNTASRLEGLTKRFHQYLLLGESMGPLVREQFLLQTVGLLQPKGKTVPAEVYTVLGERGPKVDGALEKWLADYESAVKLFRKRDFETAKKRFERCLRDRPGDYLCGMYLQECDGLMHNPPDEKWNGVFVMTEK